MLTEAQFALLVTELQGDPEELGYADLLAAGRDQDLADLLNRVDRPGRRTIPPDELQAELMNAGIWPRLHIADLAPETPLGVRAAVRTVFDIYRPNGLRYVDLDVPATTEMLAAFVAAGLISEPERTALLAIADTLVNRVSELLGAEAAVSPDDVVRLRRAATHG